MNVFSVFSGVGGFELGLPEEWKIVGISEIDKHANAVLRYRFPEVKNYGDIQRINYEELPNFDILVGGSPCQDLSIAGKRKGLSGSRSGLFFDYIKVLRERNPYYFIWENVAGALSSNEGRDFAEVISQFSSAGYDVWWQVLDATWFGIPQHRERVFVLGTLGKRSFRKIFFRRENNQKNTESRQEENRKIETVYPNHQSIRKRIYGVNGIVPTIHRATGGQMKTKIAIPVLEPAFKTTRASGRRIKTNNEPSFTLRTGVHNGVSDGMTIRYLTPLECERLMGWPDQWTQWGINDRGEKYELSDNARYNLIGNGVVPQVVRTMIDQILSGEEENSEEVNFVSDYEVSE